MKNIRKHFRVFIILLAMINTVFATESMAQNPSVLNELKSKYSLVQFHPECGGWYFISYQKYGQTLYGFTDSNGNVVASGASKYKIYPGFIELYLLDVNKKALHDQWIEDMKQYKRDYQEYLRIKKEYENKLDSYKTKVKAAKEEANSRYQYARKRAIERAQAENRANSGGGGGILGAVLSGIASGVNIAAAAESVKYDPILNQVLAERNLTVAPAEPYNPKPKEPVEPESGYYWDKFSLLQPCPYDYIDFNAIKEKGYFANVKKGNYHGLVDSYMNEIVSCTNISEVLQKNFGNGMFLIKKGGLMGVINSAAKTILPFKYNSITLENNRFKARKEGKYGLYDLKGKEVMPCIFDEMQSSNGYLLCKKNNLWGVYTADFDELYPCQFQNLNFSKINNSLILNTQIKGLWGVLDFRTGQTILPNQFTSIEHLSLGSNNKENFVVKKEKLKGLYSSEGMLLIPCEFDNIEYIKMGENDAIKASINNTIALFDLLGMTILPPNKYHNFEYNNEWFIKVCQNNKWGICSPYGEELIPCKYSNIELAFSFKDLFVGYYNDKKTLITANGIELFMPIQTSNLTGYFDLYFSSSSDNHILYETEEGTGYKKLKKLGAIDYAGNVIIKPIKYKNYAAYKKLTDKIKKKTQKLTKKHNLEAIFKEKRDIYKDSKEKVKTFLEAESAEKSSFSYFAKNYVGKVINDWQRKGNFEKTADWRKRVNNETLQQKVYELTKDAQNIYIANHSKDAIEKDIHIVGSYDADNETYRISTSLKDTELLVNVPFNDAQEFKTSFENIIKKPKFFIEDDKISLSEYSFMMPNGKVYKYSNNASLTHTIAQVDYNFDSIEISPDASNKNFKGGKQTISTINLHYGTSDVDINIPESEIKRENTYAIIIANENYENEKRVDYAYNDGQIFYEYCTKALGIPEKQVHFRSDATLNNLSFEINWMKQIAKANNGNAKFIFYYAGHGVPEDNMKDAYLLPVDGYSNDLSSGYKLSQLYSTLGEIPAENTLVLLDACFSGSQRSGEHIASTRGVNIKVKMGAPKGNMMVFSAASGSETAHSYKEKYHGLFTYFLLKKIQEEKGNVTMGELFDYVKSNVEKVSLIENKKTQTPTLAPSNNMLNNWRLLEM
ncbi:MAG: caspase family protein [Bacteroidaceae bacterium]|nr:caspase family protein [Bacteroidaceae bacterium]